MRPRTWAEAEHVLCVRLDALGDLLMTGPAIRAFKRGGGRRVTLLASPAGAAIAPYLPGVDDAMVYEAPWMKATPAAADARADRDMIRSVRTCGFDAAVIFTVYSQNPLPAAQFCYLADIPLRLAYCRENPYHLLTDWAPEREPEQGVRHEVRRQLDLVARVGAPPDDSGLQLRLPPHCFEEAETLLLVLGVDPDARWVLLHPGASASSRRYDPARFAAVADGLAAAGCSVVFTGSEAEVPLVEGIRRAMQAPSDSLAGSLPAGRLCAVIARAPLLVCNNTGPAHIAAAVGTPVVDLYALTNPQHTPWRVPHRLLFNDVPCRWCYKSVCPLGHGACLDVPPGAVVRAALDLLDQPRDPRRADRTGAPAGAEESAPMAPAAAAGEA